ncbi:MAG: hypothetical protein A2915_00760 [Candidatus Yanofskybacteria bacterium RIFCSPLOWO2_01_FULL_41_34]|uniref:Uncharacterized protein n=1 Tax=Candidatus Yanofskybacteria bacterium RIFCSPHIGHO2_01_FULL_41_26 TaxID=1802661 RepID=A0A1F8EED4_9BACT|nr:MAG: hypothetical protein A2649_02790 [Candidatus Yanofskybacteria bacterium RIFCSPHIGHO2_01_FULL_41_26]OGN22426.1 MAG: hypothetical protein A2915_00760 [Candidatus Yanofskybacteria bacterium RIFCSPLOWO2_01_FULL_41_34]
MQKVAVPVIAYRDAVHGNLKDLFEGYESPDGWREQNMARAFSGEKSNPPYRIPSVDTGTELFFDNLEVFSRFAHMPLPDQEVFCQRVRAKITEAGVERLHLTVQWSEKETKVLKIKLCAGGHHLDIYLEEEKE